MMFNEINIESYVEPIRLKKFISSLQTEFQQTASRQHSLIVNDVQEDLEVKTDPALLAVVIKRLLITIIDGCHHCCIRVSAKNFNNVVLLRIRNNVKTFQNSFEINEVQLFAETLGGCITLNTQTRKGAALIFSFINFAQAA